MVAYSFQRMFVDPILMGMKRQTVRAIGRRRHARKGDQLQLYTAMRTKQCRLVARATCKDVSPITIRFTEGAAFDQLTIDDLLISRATELDAFAVDDGFDDWGELRAFWGDHHPGVEVFEGVIIRWRDVAPGV